LEKRDEAIAKANQVVNVYEEPDNPGYQASDTYAFEIDQSI
jgi:hypothetical protein